MDLMEIMMVLVVKVRMKPVIIQILAVTGLFLMTIGLFLFYSGE